VGDGVGSVGGAAGQDNFIGGCTYYIGGGGAGLFVTMAFDGFPDERGIRAVLFYQIEGVANFVDNGRWGGAKGAGIEVDGIVQGGDLGAEML
jgi:hypothetical protein